MYGANHFSLDLFLKVHCMDQCDQTSLLIPPHGTATQNDQLPTTLVPLPATRGQVSGRNSLLYSPKSDRNEQVMMFVYRHAYENPNLSKCLCTEQTYRSNKNQEMCQLSLLQ